MLSAALGSRRRSTQDEATLWLASSVGSSCVARRAIRAIEKIRWWPPLKWRLVEGAKGRSCPSDGSYRLASYSKKADRYARAERFGIRRAGFHLRSYARFRGDSGSPRHNELRRHADGTERRNVTRIKMLQPSTTSNTRITIRGYLRIFQMLLCGQCQSRNRIAQICITFDRSHLFLY